MKKLGLCMIVKDEGAIIERCLASVLPLVDFVLMVDTGSTDDTILKSAIFLSSNNVKYEIHQKKWVDFAHNRTEALGEAYKHQEINYFLMIDADEILEFEPGFDAAKFKSALTSDTYDVKTKYGGIEYFRPTLTSNKYAQKYKGVLHEFLEVKGTRHTATGFWNVPIQDSARNKGSKFINDAITLTDALKVEQDPFMVSRYTFYLAQSYRDSGNPKSAIKNYLERAKMGFWNEEVFQSYYQTAYLMATMPESYTPQEIIGNYLLAYQTCPHRAESLYRLSRYCRLSEMKTIGKMFAQQAAQLVTPTSALFLETWIYEQGIAEELASYE